MGNSPQYTAMPSQSVQEKTLIQNNHNMPDGPYETEVVKVLRVWREYVKVYFAGWHANGSIDKYHFFITHPNNLSIYNQLINLTMIKVTFKIQGAFSQHRYVIAVEPPPINSLHGKIAGRLDIGNEIKELSDYVEIIIKDSTVRLITLKKFSNVLVVGKIYKIKYQMWYTHEFNQIIEYTLVD